MEGLPATASIPPVIAIVPRGRAAVHLPLPHPTASTSSGRGSAKASGPSQDKRAAAAVYAAVVPTPHSFVQGTAMAPTTTVVVTVCVWKSWGAGRRPQASGVPPLRHPCGVPVVPAPSSWERGRYVCV